MSPSSTPSPAIRWKNCALLSRSAAVVRGLVVAATLASVLGGGFPAQAAMPVSHHPWIVRPVLTPGGAWFLCKGHRDARFRVVIHGYLAGRWGNLGGYGVWEGQLLAPRGPNLAVQGNQRERAVVARSDGVVYAEGRLVCIQRAYSTGYLVPLRIAPPASVSHLPGYNVPPAPWTIRQVLSVTEALSMCRKHGGDVFIASVRGYPVEHTEDGSVSTVNFDGALLDHALTGNAIDTAAGARWPPPGAISLSLVGLARLHLGRWIVAHGFLICGARSPSSAGMQYISQLQHAS
jgi:hypothetical protein